MSSTTFFNKGVMLLVLTIDDAVGHVGQQPQAVLPGAQVGRSSCNSLEVPSGGVLRTGRSASSSESNTASPWAPIG